MEHQISQCVKKNALKHESAIKTAIQDGLTCEEAAIKIGIAPPTVKRYAAILGINLKASKKIRSKRKYSGIVAMREDKCHVGRNRRKRFHLSRERVRQILKRELPNFVSTVKAITIANCPICDKPHRVSGYNPNVYCSKNCEKKVSGKSWDRDFVVEIMKMRDQNATWNEIHQKLSPHDSIANARRKIQIHRYLFSKEEWAKYFPKFP